VTCLDLDQPLGCTTCAGSIWPTGGPKRRLFGGPTTLAAWRELETAVRTGETSFENVFGVGDFEYLAANPELSEQFNSFMR
jgi:hypothetical protein